ncbi:hypothetical protein HA402_000650 [Bradysia odoriphaga]|nr:hypothetical protein HA402_000650 [Bradysia odoriphaga]
MSNSFDTRLKPNFRNYDPNGRCKKISKPYILGYFSISHNRQFIPDQTNLKYLKLPASGQPIHFDLNEGYDSYQHKPDNAHQDKLNHILRYILLNLKKLAAPTVSPERTDKLLNIDVICFRGKLRMLMCTPYDTRDGWSLLATKWKGNIYLCGHSSEEEILKKQNESEELKKICTYGFKFEQFVMSDSPTSDPVSDTPVLEGEEFCCMFTTRLESTSILYGAEMDGIESSSVVDLSETDPNDLKFTELKVRLKVSNHRQIENFNRFKTRNWWCQSYLAKVEKIVVGVRTQNGIVNTLESVDVASMPQKFERFWSDTVCMDFLDNFLCMVKYVMKDVDCPHTVYKFDHDPNASYSIQCTVLQGPNDCTFIPDWYISEIQKFDKR